MDYNLTKTIVGLLAAYFAAGFMGLAVYKSEQEKSKFYKDFAAVSSTPAFINSMVKKVQTGNSYQTGYNQKDHIWQNQK